MSRKMNSPNEIAQQYVAIGIKKTKYPASKLLLLSILAGMFIAFASVGTAIASSTIENAAVAKTVSALMFPAGLSMTLIAGSELFTGNCLIIVSVLEKEVKLKAMLRNWLIVYIGNFIGSLLIAALSIYSHTYSMFGNAVANTTINTAIAKTSLGFGDAVYRGILCNFLVCIAVWMSYAAKDVTGKIIALFFPIMLFVEAGFEHSIANMYYIPAGLFAMRDPAYLAAYTSLYGSIQLDSLTIGSMFAKNLIPVTIGNIIGGMVLVGITYWFIYLREDGKKGSSQPHAKKKK